MTLTELKRKASKAANSLRDSFGDSGLSMKLDTSSIPIIATFTVNDMQPSVGLGKSSGEATSHAVIKFAKSHGWQEACC